MVGLGNPGPQYDRTRHNIGFAVVDALRHCAGQSVPADLGACVRASASSALTGAIGSEGWTLRQDFLESSIKLPDWSAFLVKPMTFMNRSGEPLGGFLKYRKLTISDLIVVHDEIDLPFGTVRVKVDGGEGGHNGLRSISESCGGRGYARVRVGVGKPAVGSPLLERPDGIASWVLSKFGQEEREQAEALVTKAALAVVELGVSGLKAAQNRFNR